jgi:hypothetical protein
MIMHHGMHMRMVCVIVCSWWLTCVRDSISRSSTVEIHFVHDECMKWFECLMALSGRVSSTDKSSSCFLRSSSLMCMLCCVPVALLILSRLA